MTSVIRQQVGEVGGRALFLRVVLFALAYVAGAWLGDWLTLKPSLFCTFWLNSGVFLAVLLRHPLRTWPWFILAAAMANLAFDLLHGRALWLAGLFALGNAGEALTGAWLLRRCCGGSIRLSTLREVVVLALGAATVATAVSATCGTIGLVLAYDVQPMQQWLRWWSCDALGVLLAAPVVLAWWRERPFPSIRAGLAEGLLLFGSCIALSSLLMHDLLAGLPWKYLAVPFIIWAALRLELRHTALLLVATAVAGVGVEVGLYAGGNQPGWYAVANVQGFFAVMALLALVLSASRCEREAAMAALRERERVVTDILESTLSGYWDWDIPGRVEYLSPAFKRMFGYDDHELENTPEAWQRLVVPEDLPGVLAGFERHVQSRGREPFWNEVRYRHKDGSVVWVICAGRVVAWADDGSPLRMVGCHIDITARKQAETELRQAEARLRTLVEILQHPAGSQQEFLDHALEQAIRLSGSQIGYIYHYSEERREFILNTWSKEVMPQCRVANPQTVYALDKTGIWGEAVRQRRPIILNDFAAAHPLKKGCPQGHVALRTFMTVPIFRGQAIVGVVGLANKQAGYTDLDVLQISLLMEAVWKVTERIQAEEERDRLEQQLRHHEKLEAIGHLAGGVAHDFNNQLQGVLGYAALLVRRLDDPELRHLAENIVTSAKRSADLTGKLLAYSRKGQFQILPVDLHRVITETVEMLRHTIDPRIRIVQRLDASRHRVSGDPSQLQNALLNLAVNARDAMPEGGVLTFATGLETASRPFAVGDGGELGPGDYLRISVIDTGCGMSPEVKARLFEPFFTTKGVGKGTGMGLASVYGTIKQHRGGITVRSEVGAGTAFELFLPLHVEVEAVDDRLPTPPGGAAVQAGLRILVVEDEPIVRSLVQDLLAPAGHQVVVVADGATAIETWRQDGGRFDLVILDMMMPQMGGADTFRALKALDPGVRAVLATGYSLDREAQALLAEGVLGFIQKPFDEQELFRLVSSLGRRRADRRRGDPPGPVVGR